MDIKTNRSTPEANKKAMEEETFDKKYMKEIGKKQGEINTYIKNIENFDSSKEKLRRYKLVLSVLIKGMQSHEVKKEWAENWLKEVESKIEDLKSEINEVDKHENEISKRNKIIDLATSGRKVQKKNKKHAKEFMRAYSDIKKTDPGLDISEYTRRVGMTKTSDNTYREWIEKFDEAEQMLSNDE